MLWSATRAQFDSTDKLVEALASKGDSEVRFSISDKKNKAVTLTVLGEETDTNARKDTETLERSLEENRRRAGGRRNDAGGTAKIRTVTVQPEFSKRMEKIAGLFGKRVVFIKDSGTGFLTSNGVVVTDLLPDTIFIYADNDYNPVAVLGHELLHHLRADRPVLYKSLRNVLFSGTIINGKVWENYRDEYNDRLEKTGFLPLSEKGHKEEYIAEYMGDLIMDEAFGRNWRQKSQTSSNVWPRQPLISSTEL